MLRESHGGLYKSLQRKKEENDRLRGEGDQIKFINLRFEALQVAGLSELC